MPKGKTGGRRRTTLAAALVLAVLAGLLATVPLSGPAAGATTAATFTRTDHPLLVGHVAVDLNKDGRLDLAGVSGPDTAGVLLSTGNGTFGAIRQLALGGDGDDVAAGDFNRDGNVDLAVSLNEADISVSLLFGNGDGTFRAPVNLPNTSGFNAPAIATTDLDGGGVLDLVVANPMACFTAPCRVNTTVSILLGNGDGTFRTRSVEVGRGITEIAVGDFNRDGAKDLAFAGDSSRVYRLYGRGDGTFVLQPTITLTADTFGVDATDVDVADFNRDSIQDLVVAIALNGSRTAVLLGRADGTFQPPLILTEPNINVPQVVAVGDYNSDGFQDLALGMANGNNGLLGLRNGNGDGTFQAQRYYEVPPANSSIGTIWLLSAQLTSDTRPDLALVFGGARAGTRVLINTTATSTSPPATPTAPSLLSPAQDATPPQPVAFDWTDVSAAATYRIQIDDSSTFSSPVVVDQRPTVSQFTAPTLAARQHWWRVRGINSAGTAGPWSAVRRFTPRSTTNPPTPGQMATLTVTATGRSGERVTSSPSGVNVAVGSTGSASFATGTSITLSVTNGRDAIWSGACSTSGNKTRTCGFTLNGNASVTANVQ
jgi:hypothetical protein